MPSIPARWTDVSSSATLGSLLLVDGLRGVGEALPSDVSSVIREGAYQCQKRAGQERECSRQQTVQPEAGVDQAVVSFRCCLKLTSAAVRVSFDVRLKAYLPDRAKSHDSCW